MLENTHSHCTQFKTAYASPRNKHPLEPRTNAQKHYICAIKNHCLTFGIGPAGTGKSYCATALAADALANGHVGRIILTRPAVEVGERLGHLPGDLNEKFSVYIDLIRDIQKNDLVVVRLNIICGMVESWLPHWHLCAGKLLGATLL